jgi:hypothetical protein
MSPERLFGRHQRVRRRSSPAPASLALLAGVGASWAGSSRVRSRRPEAQIHGRDSASRSCRFVSDVDVSLRPWVDEQAGAAALLIGIEVDWWRSAFRNAQVWNRLKRLSEMRQRQRRLDPAPTRQPRMLLAARASLLR